MIDLHAREPKLRVVLVTKDINMRLKARACGIESEDYSTDQLVDDVSMLSRGYHTMTGSFWDRVNKVETRQGHGRTWHQVQMNENLPAVHINEFIIDEQGFVGWIKEVRKDQLLILDMHQEPLLHQEAWGLKPRENHPGAGGGNRTNHGQQALPADYLYPQRAGPGPGDRLFAGHRSRENGALAGGHHR